MKITDNLDNTDGITADTAEAEESEAATGLGKFKSVKALLDAYENLEAEFTRRSQRLKELESAATANVPPAAAENGNLQPRGAEGTDETLLDAALKSEEVKNAVIGEYLAKAAERGGVRILSGGTSVPARRQTPATVTEAGRLAEDFLKRGGNK